VASWHQKVVVLDSEVAYLTGINTKATDWDSSEHAVFDERRMAFEADYDDRWDVLDQEDLPDFEPRKDYGVRLEGPAVSDIEAIFHSRWEHGRDEGDLFSEYTTPWSLPEAEDEVSGGVLTQVEATMPPPFSVQAIRETHAKAFAQAKDYIFIEDQYFRSPIMTEVIFDQMLHNPDLLLIVVSQPVSSWDGGAMWTVEGDSMLRNVFEDRYLTLQLKSTDLVAIEGWIWDTVELEVAGIFNHSKLRIIDDRYLSVGSCNYNNRGYLYEGELNVSVLDEDFATEARWRVFENLVGPDWAPYLSDDPQNNFDVLAMAADFNAEMITWWWEYGSDLSAKEALDLWPTTQTSGFVVPLDFGDDWVFDVGPDVF